MAELNLLEQGDYLNGYIQITPDNLVKIFVRTRIGKM